MFALAAAVMFLIATIKQGHADNALFWVYLGLCLWSAHFFFDQFLVPYYRRRSGAPPQV